MKFLLNFPVSFDVAEEKTELKLRNSKIVSTLKGRRVNRTSIKPQICLFVGSPDRCLFIICVTEMKFSPGLVIKPWNLFVVFTNSNKMKTKNTKNCENPGKVTLGQAQKTKADVASSLLQCNRNAKENSSLFSVWLNSIWNAPSVFALN
jgi:hypothetical protein